MSWITKPPPGVQINWTNPLTKGLVGCWLFNESAGIRTNDLSGNNNTGTLNNMIPSSSSGWGGSGLGSTLYFDGINDYVDVAGLSYFLRSGSFSLSLWVRIANISKYGMIFHLGDAPSNNDIALLILPNSPRFWFMTHIPGAWQALQSQFLSPPKINLLYNIICVFNNNVGKSIYINGNLDISTTTQKTRGSVYSIEAQIGRATDGTDAFTGDIPALLFWKDRILSAEDARQLYAQPFAMFNFQPRKVAQWAAR